MTDPARPFPHKIRMQVRPSRPILAWPPAYLEAGMLANGLIKAIPGRQRLAQPQPFGSVHIARLVRARMTG